jgi:hypothetical protein
VAIIYFPEENSLEWEVERRDGKRHTISGFSRMDQI